MVVPSGKTLLATTSKDPSDAHGLDFESTTVSSPFSSRNAHKSVYILPN